MLYFQLSKHFINCLFLLFHIWMNIKIKSCADIGMSKQYTNSFIIAIAFYAPSSEAMTKSVKFKFWYFQLL